MNYLGRNLLKTEGRDRGEEIEGKRQRGRDRVEETEVRDIREMGGKRQRGETEGERQRGEP